MQKAFVLGAGLGTRLKSLTKTLPKPLIPFFQRPLITYAFDHLIDLGIGEFIVNTHHVPEAYDAAFPHKEYRARPITFRNEPVLLETAGGIGNIADLLAGDPCIVYNGDILTDLPLRPALDAHRASGNAVTLVLRSSGDARHVAWDAEANRVTDIRNLLGTGNAGTHQFTGIYLIEPEFVQRIDPSVKMSVIPHFLDLIREGRGIGGFVSDSGVWWDLGDRTAYLAAHHAMLNSHTHFPAYARDSEQGELRIAVHSSAEIAESAQLNQTIVGAGATVGIGAKIERSVLWPGASVADGSQLSNCIVRTGQLACGHLQDVDV